MSETLLRVTYGTSRGRDTYGYTIVTLHDDSTGKRYRCMGGGYDMLGTVVGEWLQDVAQDKLKALRPYCTWTAGTPGTEVDKDGLYGLSHTHTRKLTSTVARVDGACGLSSVERIAKECRITLRQHITPRGRTHAFLAVTA